MPADPPRPAPDRHAETTPPPLPRITIFLLMTLGTLGQLALNIMLPSLPAIARAFDAVPGTERLILSVFLIGFAGGQLVVGPLSDRFGRRRILLPGLTLYALTSFVVIAAPSMETLLAARLVQGIGAAAGFVVARAIVRDCFEGPALVRLFGMLTLAMGFTPGIAPVIGGALQDAFDWQATAFATGIIGVAVVTMCALFVPETGVRTSIPLSLRSIGTGYVSILGERTFRRFGGTNALTLGSLYAYYAGGPELFIVQFGLTPTAFGWLAVVHSAAFVLGAAASARFSNNAEDTAGPVIKGVFVLLASAAVMLVMGLLGLTGIIPVMVCMTIFGFALGVVLSIGVAGALSPFKARAGAATAMLGATQMSAGAIASAVVGAFPHHPAIVFPAVMTAMLAVALWNIRRPSA